MLTQFAASFWAHVCRSVLQYLPVRVSQNLLLFLFDLSQYFLTLKLQFPSLFQDIVLAFRSNLRQTANVVLDDGDLVHHSCDVTLPRLVIFLGDQTFSHILSKLFSVML